MKIVIKQIENDSLVINSEFEDLLQKNGIDSYDALCKLSGESVKKKLVLRGTERIMLESGQEKVETYIKRYLPLPFKEYFKAIVSFRPFFPSGALHEWEAIIAFHEAGIPTMRPIAVGNNGEGKSALLTLGIQNYKRASELFASWKGNTEKRQQRLKLIANIAELAGKMHYAEFAHQDFYLVHIFVKDELEVLPIDLQRIIFPNQFRRRWRVKDIGQLLYSSLEFTSLTDRLYFWKIYTEIVGKTFYRDKSLLKSILRKAYAIRSRSNRKKEKSAKAKKKEKI